MMPYINEYVEPEVLVKVEHITIYYTYKYGEYDNPLSYWYSAETDEWGDPSEFDVRDLPNYKDHPNEDDRRNTHAAIVKEAILLGHLNDYLDEAGIEPITEGEENTNG